MAVHYSPSTVGKRAASLNKAFFSLLDVEYCISNKDGVNDCNDQIKFLSPVHIE